jgi:hypothetical protein
MQLDPVQMANSISFMDLLYRSIHEDASGVYKARQLINYTLSSFRRDIPRAVREKIETQQIRTHIHSR